jgi:hypothetical protein
MGCARHTSQLAPVPVDKRADVRLVSDEAEAVARILSQRLAGVAPLAADWHRLFSTQGYEHLAERERGMRRAFGD